MRFSSSAPVVLHHKVLTYPDSSEIPEPECGRARLLYPSRGVLLVSSSSGHWVVSSTRAIWLMPGIRHEIRTLGETRVKTFYFEQDQHPELPRDNCVLHVTPLLLEVMRALVQYASDPQPGPKAMLVAELLLCKIIYRTTPPIDLPEPRDRRLAEICAHIQLHPDDATTLAQFAQQLDCSERTLHRLFMQETGMSFTRWRHQAKLSLALEWLAQGRSILDIALDLGYQNQGAFSAMFRKYFGKPPSHYARNA